jgi:hypothetical protein
MSKHVPDLKLIDPKGAESIYPLMGYDDERRYSCGSCLYFWDAPHPVLDRDWVPVCRLLEGSLGHLEVSKELGLCSRFQPRPAGLPDGASADLIGREGA